MSSHEFGTALSALLLLGLSYTAMGSPTMKYPPNSPSQTERFVDREERDGLTCLNKIREIASNVTGIVETSETITFSNEHGYIVRYDVNQNIEYNGVNYTSNAKVVITTANCIEIEMQYNPIFELPNS